MDAWWRLYLSLILVPIVHITLTFSLEFNLSTHQFHFEAGVMRWQHEMHEIRPSLTQFGIKSLLMSSLGSVQCSCTTSFEAAPVILGTKLYGHAFMPTLTSPGAVKPSSHIQPLHSLLQLSFMSTDCSHEGKIGKGSKVSEFDEWNRIRHCRSACSLSLYWFGVLAWHISIVSPSCTKNPRQLLHWNSPTC